MLEALDVEEMMDVAVRSSSPFQVLPLVSFKLADAPQLRRMRSVAASAVMVAGKTWKRMKKQKMRQYCMF